MGKNLTRAELVLDTKSVELGAVPGGRTNMPAWQSGLMQLP